MHIAVGQSVTHPTSGQEGKVLRIYQNPACLMKYLVIQWQDGDIEEVEQLLFGPLEDD